MHTQTTQPTAENHTPNERKKIPPINNEPANTQTKKKKKRAVSPSGKKPRAGVKYARQGNKAESA